MAKQSIKFDHDHTPYGEWWSVRDFMIQKRRNSEPYNRYKIYRTWDNVTRTDVIGYVSELATAKKIVRMIING